MPYDGVSREKVLGIIENGLRCKVFEFYLRDVLFPPGTCMCDNCTIRDAIRDLPLATYDVEDSTTVEAPPEDLEDPDG